MNRGKIFRKRFNQQLHDLHDTADHLQTAVHDRAAMLAEQTRDGWKKSQKMMSGWEKTVEDSVKSNPMLYFGTALAAVALASLLAAGMIMSRRH